MIKTYKMKAVDEVGVICPTLRHWSGGSLLGVVGGWFQMGIGKDFSGGDRGSCGGRECGQVQERIRKTHEQEDC